MGLLSRALRSAGGRMGGKYGAMARTLNRSSSRGYKPDLARIGDALTPASGRNVDVNTAIGVGSLASGLALAGPLGYATYDPRSQAQGNPELLALLDEIAASNARTRSTQGEIDRISGGESPFGPAMDEQERKWRLLQQYERSLPPQEPPFEALQRGIWPGATRENAWAADGADPYQDTGLTPEERRALLRQRGRGGPQ